MRRSAVDEIVKQRVDHAQGEFNVSRAHVFASVVGHEVYTKLTEEGQIATVKSAAASLGVSIAKPTHQSSVHSGKVQHEQVEDEERRKYFGDLPTELIVDVKNSIGIMVPDNMSAELAMSLSGRIMQAVQNEPGIEISDAYQLLRDSDTTVKTVETMSEEGVMIFSGLVAIAYANATEYFSRHNGSK